MGVRGPINGEKRVLKAVMNGLVWPLCMGLEVMALALELMVDDKMVQLEGGRKWWLWIWSRR